LHETDENALNPIAEIACIHTGTPRDRILCPLSMVFVASTLQNPEGMALR